MVNFLTQMYPLILLQTGLPSELWEITKVTPYSPLAYGAVIAILLAGNFIFYSSWKEQIKYNRERTQKSLEFQYKLLAVMSKVEMRLSDQKDSSESVRDMIRDLDKFSKQIDEINRTLDRKVNQR